MVVAIQNATSTTVANPPGCLSTRSCSPLPLTALVNFGRAAMPLSTTKVGKGSLGGRAFDAHDDTASPGVARQYVRRAFAIQTVSVTCVFELCP